MNALNDRNSVGTDFNDYDTLSKLESLHYALICLIQTAHEGNPILNELYFSGMVKKLTEKCFENANPSLLLLQQNSQPKESEYTNITFVGAFEELDKRLSEFFLRKNKYMFTRLFRMINLIVILFVDIDVTDFDISTITYYIDNGFEIDEYFCQFPEFKKYLHHTIDCGPVFRYHFVP